MNIKFYQMIDNIHGSIYYTNLEKKVINTPFFNRLHDVNQSSTVYLTFPPNRTKRYEHSLGTMQLTSDIFYNAAVNSIGSPALKLLMEKTDIEFQKIISFIKEIKRRNSFVFSFEQNTLKIMDIFKNKSYEDIKNIINKDFGEVFEGNCLLNLVPGYSNDGYECFLFLCLIQSLRLVGLLHDIGHPPQSHIIESVLMDVYDEVRDYPDAKMTTRQKSFLKTLSTYNDINNEFINSIDESMAIKSEVSGKEHLHEMIGIQIISCIVDQVFVTLMNNCIEPQKTNRNIINTLYYFTIIEFIFAIIRNKNSFWKGLHSIIDGTIDTDRLDCVPRDARNSGMTWGKVPYKRLINTVKFGVVSDKTGNDAIYICFSHKNVQLMDDLLMNRYQIFTTINYHHRSAKIAALYKGAVKCLILEYLESDEPDLDDKVSFSNISGLWRAIKFVYAKDSSILNIVQWNDSWLNGLLYRHLVEELDNPSDSNCMKMCCYYLQEIFFSQKRHLSLIKRKTELDEINASAKFALEPFFETIGNELVTPTDDATEEAYDFLIDIFYAIMDMDWGMFELKFIDLIPNAIKSVLDKYSNVIESYIIEKVNFSTGVGDAYVYNYNDEILPYKQCSSIKERLDHHRLDFPYYYIYICPNAGACSSITDDFFSKLREEIGKSIAKSIEKSVKKVVGFGKSI